MIEFGHGTHRGLRREINEDTYYADPGSGLFLVADGMGGRDRGDRAAAAARDGVVRDLDLGKSLHEAVRRASRCVTKACPRPLAGTTPVGTTLAALRLSNGGFDIAWVGDSCIHLWHAGAWYGLSRLQDTPARLVELGLMQATPPADDNAPTSRTSAGMRRHRLTQTLGVTPIPDLQVQTLQGRLASGMRFLLCSDGLREQLADGSMRALVGRGELGAQECVDQLIYQALNAGGRDNLTAVLVRIS